MLKSKHIALIFAVGFIAPGILGFFPNPIVSPHGLFEVNVAHNLVHLLTGAAFLLGGTIFSKHARQFLQVIGIVYVLVSIVGFLTPGDHLFGFIHINTADKWLHVGLAALLLFTGFFMRTQELSKTAVS